MCLTVHATQGDGGVLRLAYHDGGKPVGEARLLGETVGDVEVYEGLRRRGYGLRIVEDLVRRGGRSAIAVTGASQALFRKAGFATADGCHFRLDG